MTDKKQKHSLTQEEIDKAVAGGRPGTPRREHCGDHWCDKTHQCNEPFTEGCHEPFKSGFSVQRQECDEHTCDPNYECPKPFQCAVVHGSE